ncbi:S41 family peptidase [Prevotella disiens]|uniref:S41 family peptidase n=1 Tax=Prevotella disiens TaxID=28130 RepID=UPI00242EC952|nr:S41 family peptidase [Prevotella disiens]
MMFQQLKYRFHAFIALLSILFILSFLSSCVTNDEQPDTVQGNVEALWQILDEHYCFFEQKGIDWKGVRQRYLKQINGNMTERQQFEIMANMLSELKDGHVNLFTSFNIGRYWSWRENYPQNYSDSLERKYLKTNYLIASGMDYTILDDNIGYLRCESFQNGIGAGNLDDILLYFQPCRALIIDIRNNSGGALTNAEELAARFTNEAVLVGYMQHKTGKGHTDFSPMREQILKPGKGIRWQKPVVVLTNRSVFSAANEFVKYMRCCPMVKIVGDRTGGGAGLPFSSELPNGWGIRFSACPMYDKDKNLTEFGINPDYKVDLTTEDFNRGRDTIIEFARHLLAQ